MSDGHYCAYKYGVHDIIIITIVIILTILVLLHRLPKRSREM